MDSIKKPLLLGALGSLLLIQFCNCSPSEDQNVAIPPVPELPGQTKRLELETHEKSANRSRPSCTTAEHEDPAEIHNGVIDKRARWQNFSVFIDPVFDDKGRRLINNGMYRLQQVLPCVRFAIYRPNSRPSGDYIHIIEGNGCWSKTGKIGGRQELSLGNGCVYVGTIMHEMIHALGVKHEHQRADRNDYVTINRQNIEPGKEHNFEPVSPREYSTFGVAYNQRSIMHYDGTAFSKDGRAPTITAKNGKPVGSTGELQQTDIQLLQNMYECK